MRIHQNSAFLVDLIRRVRAGQLQPAGFQRPYVWERSHVLAMCESLLAGYPLGGFLTWVPPSSLLLSPGGRNRLGPIEASHGERPNGLLLDGQNRLATLAWLMREPGATLPADLSPAERLTWGSGECLVLDLEAHELRFIAEDQAENGFYLPSSVLVRNPHTMRLVRERWDGAWSQVSEEARNDGLRWLDACIDAFSEARVTETVLENASPAEAKKAFLHICRVGVPISESDFDDALASIAVE